MPANGVQNTVRFFSDPQELEAAYSAARVDLTPTGRTTFAAQVVELRFPQLWMQQVHEAAPRIKHAEQAADRAFIKFLPLPGEELAIQGATLPYEGILRHSRGHSYFERTATGVHWSSMSLPVEQLASTSIAVCGRDLTPPRDASIVIPAPNIMTRLRQLHREAAALAMYSPDALTRPEAAHGLEQVLVEAMVDALAADQSNETSWARQCHAAIMRRFQRLLAEHPGQPLYIPEICAAIRVPERTLRLCCQEHLGMSPKQYLLLRRLHLVQRALCAAAPDETTVTETATRFGFWHFGRFAGNYRSVFGETPSATLHRAAT